MASNVGICNRALIAIGEDTILSLTEDSKPGRICNQLFEPIRDAVLRDHKWNFAIKRVELAELSTTPAFKYAKEFQLPADCLRVIQMEYSDMEFKIEGRKLLTNESTAKILYVSKVTDPNQFDELFVEALAARLAAELAVNLADDNVMFGNLLEVYQQKLRLARSIDAMEGTPDTIEADTWLNSRY